VNQGLTGIWAANSLFAMRRFPIFCCAASFLCLALAADARAPTSGDTLASAFEDGGITKKVPRFIYRPRMSNPAAQLEHANALLRDGKTRKALKQFRALVHEWHESDEAVSAQTAFASLLLKKGKHERAFDEYQYLIDFFAGEFPLEMALEEQFRIANYVRTARRGRVLMLPGVIAPERSLKLFETIVSNGPNWSRSPEAQFFIGLTQEGRKEFELAIAAYENLTLRYPGNALAAASDYRRAYCMYRVSRSSPRDEQRCRLALSALIQFHDRHPDDPDSPQAGELADELKSRLSSMYFERADFYDRIAKRPRAAIIAYSDFIRKFPKSEQRQWIDGRIAALEQKLAEEEGPK
jgi:outer membrane protein assembly factor BamD (BamD/ComL family)